MFKKNKQFSKKKKKKQFELTKYRMRRKYSFRIFLVFVFIRSWVFGPT